MLREGLVPKGKTYRLREVFQPDEGSPLGAARAKNGATEWSLYGVSSHIVEMEPRSTGWEITTVTLAYHCGRQSGYYVWKVMMPLHMLFALVLPVYNLDPANLEGRINTVATYFTAAFAMM